MRGKMQTRSWDQDGQTKYMTEIVVQGFGGEIQMLDSKGSGDSYSTPPKHGTAQTADAGFHNKDLDDEIPF